MSYSANCIDIRNALSHAKHLDLLHSFAYYPACQDDGIPYGGLEVAYFPETDSVMLAPAGQRARTFEVPWRWRMTLPAVLDLLDDYNNPDSFVLPIYSYH